MRYVIMSFLVLGSAFMNNLVMNQSIPTQQEQANLLLNVQEVFEQVKLLTKDMAESTDQSVIQDIELMTRRAEEGLELLEEVILLRLSCQSNSVCMLESRAEIRRLSEDGRNALTNCTIRGGEDIKANSMRLSKVTNTAIDRGQQFLDSLEGCSKKLGLQVIACYRNIITKDTVPVKTMLLGAIDAHRESHFRAIEVRNEASTCVEETVIKYRALMEKHLKNAGNCS